MTDPLIGKRFRTKVEDMEEDEDHGPVRHLIGSTFIVQERIEDYEEGVPTYMVAWEQAVDQWGESVPARGMWTIWMDHEIASQAEECK